MRELQKALKVVYVMPVVMFVALHASWSSSKLFSANLEPIWKDSSLFMKTAFYMALGRMLTMLTSLARRLF